VTQQWLWSLISTAGLGYRMRLLRELLRVGRTSLVIGLATLASAIALGDFLRIGEIVRETFTIAARRRY
jgi:hypothetical protein